MKTRYKAALWTLLFVGVLSLIILYIATHNIPVLHPKGLIALKQRNLLVTASLIMCIVVIPTLLMTLFFSVRYKEGSKGVKYRPDWAHSYLAEFIWWGVPFVIIVVLAIMTWTSTHELNPFTPIASKKKPLEIQVVALEWKWLFIYPEQGIATVNFLQIPKDTPINFEITADAPMNSFWIPALGGQIYAMPAMRTKLHLMATEEGDFRGSSSNISGDGFAGMYFTVRSSTDEAFSSWVDHVKDSSDQLSYDEYKKLALPSQYNPAHYYGCFEENLFNQIVMKYMYTKDGVDSHAGQTN